MCCSPLMCCITGHHSPQRKRPTAQTHRYLQKYPIPTTKLWHQTVRHEYRRRRCMRFVIFLPSKALLVVAPGANMWEIGNNWCKNDVVYQPPPACMQARLYVHIIPEYSPPGPYIHSHDTMFSTCMVSVGPKERVCKMFRLQSNN